jgi:hypothetical protein
MYCVMNTIQRNFIFTKQTSFLTTFSKSNNSISNMKVSNPLNKNIISNTTITSPEMEVRLKTREELAAEFNICAKTMRKKLKIAAIILPKGLLQVHHQQLVRDVILGIPNNSQKFPLIPLSVVVEPKQRL